MMEVKKPNRNQAFSQNYKGPNTFILQEQKVCGFICGSIWSHRSNDNLKKVNK